MRLPQHRTPEVAVSTKRCYYLDKIVTLRVCNMTVKFKKLTIDYHNTQRNMVF